MKIFSRASPSSEQDIAAVGNFAPCGGIFFEIEFLTMFQLVLCGGNSVPQWQNANYNTPSQRDVKLKFS